MKYLNRFFCRSSAEDRVQKSRNSGRGSDSERRYGQLGPMSNFRLHVVVVLTAMATAACGVDGVETSANDPISLPALSSSPILLGKDAVVGVTNWPQASSALGGSGSPMAGVVCATTEKFHFHTHLTIIGRGTILALPADIGLTGCAYELHTHDNSGVIHIEADQEKTFTLGQFFSVWGRTLSRVNVAGVQGPVIVYVQDATTLIKYEGDIGALELKPYRSITLVVGGDVQTVPTFTWPEHL